MEALLLTAFGEGRIGIADTQCRLSSMAPGPIADAKGLPPRTFAFLGGIVPSGAGVPQIEVSFVYSNDYSLRVSANDLQGNRTRALSVKNKIYLG